MSPSRSSPPRYESRKGSPKLAAGLVFGAIFAIAVVGVAIVLFEYHSDWNERDDEPPEVREPAPEIEELPDNDRRDPLERERVPEPEGERLPDPDPGPYPPPNPEGDRAGAEPGEPGGEEADEDREPPEPETP